MKKNFNFTIGERLPKQDIFPKSTLKNGENVVEGAEMLWHATQTSALDADEYTKHNQFYFTHDNKPK